jgi:hypothetical protein
MATDETADEQRCHAELVRVRCALDIAYAQYRRALTLSLSAEQPQRSAARAEARRLLGVAAGLSDRADALLAEQSVRPSPPGNSNQHPTTRSV